MKVKGKKKKKLMRGSPFCDETWTLDSSRPDWKNNCYSFESEAVIATLKSKPRRPPGFRGLRTA